jgi:3-oxoacyl-[acyl-carrier-protein] synthase I
MASEPSVVVGVGACTPVGNDAWSSAAAVRAGINAFVEHPFMVDTEGEPVRVAFARWLDVSMPVPARLEVLLSGAIEEALFPLADLAHVPLRVALALGLPSPRPGVPTDIESNMRASLSKRHRSILSSIATFPRGHAGGLLALDAARRALDDGAYDACLVAGVDSYLDPDALEWLEQNDQLHGAGPLNNAWGFVPGEAASAVLLMSHRSVEANGLVPLSRLLGIGVAVEPKRIKTETVCTGEGMTVAFRGALAAAPPGSKVNEIYCDMNGEPYRADEFGFATVRTTAAFEDTSRFQAPADCWGDVGAASGPLHVGLATIAHLKRYSEGPLCLVWGSSENGERCAALLRCIR